jgi:hypothetical protein
MQAAPLRRGSPFEIRENHEPTHRNGSTVALVHWRQRDHLPPDCRVSQGDPIARYAYRAGWRLG